MQKIIHSLHDNVLALPDDTVVVPGMAPRLPSAKSGRAIRFW